MFFNSLDFAFFLPIVFALYWIAGSRRLKTQNLILLVSSYFFYASWDWRFLFLLLFSTSLDYFSGIKISESQNQKYKKTWLLLSILINLGFLGVFKYYNFFISSFAEAIFNLGLDIDTWTLKVILPVGISFYTFHGLSYVIDIYNKKIQAEKNFVDYSVFVSFFPLLVAGPIERATHLLPQIKHARTFNYGEAVSGLRQILWGLFKKIVIADQCAEFANNIFNNYTSYSGSTLLIGAIFFTFQIYGDFSGYSDIALGTARLFGIKLLRNFAFPYFSRDIAEFWRRWHISLSSWFKDYLYIPLGGSTGSLFRRIRNVFIIFLVSGFWHGANWTFIAWGFLNALYIIPSIIFRTNRKNLDIVAKGRILPTTKEFISIFNTFALTVFAWIFFRSDSIGQAIHMIMKIFSQSLLSLPHFPGLRNSLSITVITIFFVLIEWLGREQQFAIERAAHWPKRYQRWSAYILIILLIFLYQGKEQQFIYFQF